MIFLRFRGQVAAMLVLALLNLPSVWAADRPNILWLSIEDASRQLGAYGTEHAVTPNLDALAERGVRFDRAYAPAPVCAVARSALITGIYSVAQGSQFMRTEIIRPESVMPFPWYMREAGYFTSNRVKTDYQFPIPGGMCPFVFFFPPVFLSSNPVSKHATSLVLQRICSARLDSVFGTVNANVGSRLGGKARKVERAFTEPCQLFVPFSGIPY